MTENTEKNEVPNNSAVMYELKQIHLILSELRETQKDFRITQQAILSELGGNGGPGIRTRLHSLETGYNHVVAKLDKIESNQEKRSQEFKTLCDEMEERVDEQEKKTDAMRNIGAGIVVGLAILEALRWIIPLLANQSP